MAPAAEENDEDLINMPSVEDNASSDIAPQFAAVPEGGYTCLIRKGDSLAFVANEASRLGLRLQPRGDSSS
jgi:hypothetical protein